ncbi:hypothetical protein BDD43_3881 [Mucilaginibacter gracilis]|uniref:Uncharacterized protein n=1 Tax=Mucilaginibacter gracilis TaxID=423350 RepID=A0A495J3Y2_9SPHI|nr:hypothetical protein BDD43_3881 [Mucilaginibacter gracilis]
MTEYLLSVFKVTYQMIYDAIKNAINWRRAYRIT